ANVCDILIPSPAQRQALSNYVGDTSGHVYLVRVGQDYRPEDAAVLRSDSSKAYTRMLAAAVLLRKWDFHDENLGYVGGTSIPIMFDNDQSFRHPFLDANQYVRSFFNDLANRRLDGARLLDRINLDELAEAARDIEIMDFSN